MKYSYEIKELNINGNKHMYFALEEGLERVSTFINSDIGGDGAAHFFIGKIKSVLNGEKSDDFTGGNTSTLLIKSDVIEVKDKYFDNGVVRIEPIELILLIEKYIEDKKRYMENLT